MYQLTSSEICIHKAQVMKIIGTIINKKVQIQ